MNVEIYILNWSIQRARLTILPQIRYQGSNKDEDVGIYSLKSDTNHGGASSDYISRSRRLDLV
jgi:hypothetical protein